jgi:hypothetical protein
MWMCQFAFLGTALIILTEILTFFPHAGATTLETMVDIRDIEVYH